MTPEQRANPELHRFPQGYLAQQRARMNEDSYRTIHLNEISAPVGGAFSAQHVLEPPLT